MAYFSFTTLSTVGFGDYYPGTSGERLFMVFIMVGGIMCFSYIMGLFTEILNVFFTIDSDVEEYEALGKFWGLLENFNKKPIKESIRKEINEYFEYKWKNDCNLAMETEHDLALMDQLPNLVQRQIYTQFLYNDFLYHFRRFFSIRRVDTKHKNAFYLNDF